MKSVSSKAAPQAPATGGSPQMSEPATARREAFEPAPQERPRPAAQSTQVAAGLVRKGRLFAAGLIATARSNPGAVVDLASLTGKVVSGSIRQPRPGQVSVQPLGKNPRPDGIELLVLDMCSQPGGHGDWTSYVASARLEGNPDIETLLLKDGVVQDFCGSLQQLIAISQMKDPPEVLSISFGGSPALDFQSLFDEKVLSHFIQKEGADKSKWSGPAVSNYLFNTRGLSIKALRDFQKKISTKCEDGMPFSKKRIEAFEALIKSGITVVLAAGNDGAAQVILKEAGLAAPEGFFTDLLFSRGETLPAGVIVVGGSEMLADGRLTRVFYSSPNPAVDVYAGSNDVEVNSEGLTLSGTSYAAPQVAALAAKILAINPLLKPAVVEQIIVSTATPLDHDEGGQQVGVMHEERALAMARKSLPESSV